MKLPYVVPPNAVAAYQTDPAMSSCPTEVDRQILADDFQWDEGKVPKFLQEWCGDELSRIFHRIDPLPFVLPKDVDMLMDVYVHTIPLKFSVPLIEDGRYWERTFKTKWPTQLELSVKSWKELYLSSYLQEYLEQGKVDTFILEDAEVLAALISPHIYVLKITELQMKRQPVPIKPEPQEIIDWCEYSQPKVYDHIPLETILNKLKNLTEISIQFCVKNLNGFGYQKRFFEFSNEDCIGIGKGLLPLKYLRIFRINKSNLDCYKLKILLQYLVQKPSIEELDFSHCQVGDLGMKALAGFLHVHENLKVLKVCNNKFGEVGMQGLAYALTMKPAAPIETIDMRLNTLSSECARNLSSAFVRCREKPQTLNVSACGLYGQSAVMMVGLLCLNRSLRKFDVSANNLSGDAEKKMIDSLVQNRRILEIDLRNTKISPETEKRVEELLLRNKSYLTQDIEPSDEIPPLYLNEPEYLVWEYNPNNPDYIPGRYPVRVQEI